MIDKNGFLLIDKPLNVTSFDVVSKVRRSFGGKVKGENKLRVGHSGTLDPLATGLMLVAVGSATKFLEYLIGCDKEYEVVANFGAKSETYDSEGQITEMGFDLSLLSIKKIEQKIKEQFLGKISQVPPKYSALKINGKRACDLVRSGKDVDLKEREVVIKKFQMVEQNDNLYKFVVQCSKGTYIRSLVHDLGLALGCGAYVKELRRTKLGVFDISQVSDELLPLEILLEQFTSHNLTAEQVKLLEHGKKVSVDEFTKYGQAFSNLSKKPVLAVYDKKVMAVLEEKNGFLGLRKLV
jgi:tRNA pseudouridine55 synthase